MKNSLANRFLILTLLLNIYNCVQAQSLTVGRSTIADSVYLYGRLITIINKEGSKYICYYETNDNIYYYSGYVDDYIDSTYRKVKTKRKIDKYLGLPETIVSDEKIFINEVKVGKLSFTKGNRLKVDIVITKIGLAENQHLKIFEDINKKYDTEFKPNQVEYTFKIDYSEELKWIENERLRKEKERIDNFYDYVFYSLNQTLRPIEGIYKSIDQGEKFNYDVVVLKSDIQNFVYEVYVLQTSDSDLKVGDVLFKLTETSEADKFVMEYNTKDGKVFENKLAIFNGGVLTGGVKSFVKMLLPKLEAKDKSIIDTLVDWDACGSGVLLNTKGYIATNYHVTKGAKKILVKFTNSENKIFEYIAKIVVQSEQNDIAIIQITDTNYNANHLIVKSIKLSENLSLGQDVFTLGYPNPIKLGENVKLNKGIVSAKEAFNNKCYFQTDLPVWFGNSGGPCYNSNGELIGLVTRIVFDKNQKVENVCYVVNSSCIYQLFNDELKNETSMIENKFDLSEPELPELVKSLISNSVFIKIYY